MEGKNYNLRLISLVFFILISLFLNAQDIFKADHYAINNKGDTLRGFIEEIGESRITIASLKNDQYKVMKLSTKSIIEYNLNDTIYRSVPVNKNDRDFVIDDSTDDKSGSQISLSTFDLRLSSAIFLKLIIDGPVCLFERNIMRIKLMDYMENDDAKGFVQRIPEKQLYLHKGGKDINAVRINRNNFNAAATYVFSDKERIRKRLRSDYYTFDNLDQLILDYNYLVSHNID